MFAFGVQYDSPYEDKGEYCWRMDKYVHCLEQAVEVYLGRCTYPMIPQYSQPTIYFAIQINGRGEETDIRKKFIRDVDQAIKTGRKFK